MRMDLPQCNLKSCRNNFDHNCRSKELFDICEYTYAKAELNKSSQDLNKVKTRGDVIRESNESLAEFINDIGRNVCLLLDKDEIIEYLNQPESEE